MFLLKDTDWEIKKTKEKGLGVFAKKEIKAGTVISDYLGKIINIAHQTVGFIFTVVTLYFLH